MLLNEREQKEFRVKMHKKLQEIVKNCPINGEQSELFSWSQGVQSIAIKIFESRKGFVPDLWLIDTKNENTTSDNDNAVK